MLSGFRKLSLIGQLLSALGVLGVVIGAACGAYAYVRHQGYVEGEAMALARCEAEKAAQRAANMQAIDAATRALVLINDQLNIRTQELDDAREALEQAAVADPLGARECLGAGSVQRLNAIR